MEERPPQGSEPPPNTWKPPEPPEPESPTQPVPMPWERPNTAAMTDRMAGVPGWLPPGKADPAQKGRYLRSIAWAIAAWVACIGAVYFIAQVLGHREIGGYLGLAGFVFGYWAGGTLGGIKSGWDWVQFVAILTGLAFLTLGFGACLAAMVVYG